MPTKPSSKLAADSQRATFALGVVLVALGAAGFAIAFRAALAALLGAFTGEHDVVAAMKQLPWWGRVLAPGVARIISALAEVPIGFVSNA